MRIISLFFSVAEALQLVSIIIKIHVLSANYSPKNVDANIFRRMVCFNCFLQKAE
jgi:hypothetical protein